MNACILIAAILVSASVLAFLNAEQCGRQAGGAFCPNGECCSDWGWCGMTTVYCNENLGCQSNCRCGRDFSGLFCSGDRCCSFWGYCGTSALHCCTNAGCQSNCNCPSNSVDKVLAYLRPFNKTGPEQPWLE